MTAPHVIGLRWVGSWRTVRRSSDLVSRRRECVEDEDDEEEGGEEEEEHDNGEMIMAAGMNETWDGHRVIEAVKADAGSPL